MSAGSRNAVGLEWVRLDGRDAHVSEFGGLPPGGRPDVTCPECGDALVLKLGEVRAWHAAHKPGAVCALSVVPSGGAGVASCFLASFVVPWRVGRGCWLPAFFASFPWGLRDARLAQHGRDK